MVINDLVGKVRLLGPLAMPRQFKKWDEELQPVEGLETEVSTHV